jgi:EAL domain-containing protein (putative c-di-GMP-specific phosphodiesterase class I)
MDEAMRRRQSLQADLRQALQTDDIWLAYQPQVNGVGHVVGVEALVRWTHAQRGEIAPSIFVPLAEESGLIEPLGMRVFRRACEDSARFGDLIIAVNISAAQLRLTTLLSQMQEVVQDTCVDPTRIDLEITEGLLLGDDGQTHACLKRLRAMGFRIALDDFGTGYSSLSYLRRYPIDKIKIDRSFITNLGIDDCADAVVDAIVRLAAALNLSVIAEGVETEGQRLRLAALGCTNVQGYLFGRPMPSASIEEMIRPYGLREMVNA